MAKQHVNATINGDNIELLCDSTQTLLDVLRDELDMTAQQAYMAKSRTAKRLKVIVDRIEQLYDEDAT